MVPCLYQGNIYIKRKLWVWRDQKCIILVGAKISLTCAGRQTTLSQGTRYTAENTKLRKLWWTYRHGTVLHQGNIYFKKEATGVERPEMYFSSRCKIPLTCAGCRITRLKGVGIGPRTETSVNWGGSIAMVPYLYQYNIYIKRKLLVWRVQKCIPKLCAKTPLCCVGRQTTLSQGTRYRVEKGKLCKLGWTYRHGSVFAPRQ